MPDSKASPEPLLPERLARAITLGGPIPVAQFMAAANAHYYGTRDPLGASGDFVTAPEISQMFGELIGLWLADLWDRSGRPAVHYVELGPGRGTLAKDALRAMAKAGLTPPVHFVETSETLRAAQKAAVSDATWHDDVTTLPDDAPLLIVANEFFDALPVYQLVRRAESWHERLVACQDLMFLPIAGKPVPDEIVPEQLRDAAPGSIIESSPASVAIVRALAKRLLPAGGAQPVPLSPARPRAAVPRAAGARRPARGGASPGRACRRRRHGLRRRIRDRRRRCRPWWSWAGPTARR